MGEQDSDLVISLRYLIAATRTVLPGASAEPLALLRAPQQLPMAEPSTTFNNEMEALPRKFVLVLDDYYLLGGQEVHEFLNTLMLHWPRTLYLVLITRVDPPLPLARRLARLMLDQGDREGAFRWADAFTAPVPNRPLPWADIPHVTRARTLLVRNRADDARLALQILDELLDIAERTHNTRSKITILALRALALDAQGHAGQALMTLQEAVDLSRPRGFLRPFVDLGPSMEVC